MGLFDGVFKKKEESKIKPITWTEQEKEVKEKEVKDEVIEVKVEEATVWAVPVRPTKPVDEKIDSSISQDDKTEDDDNKKDDDATEGDKDEEEETLFCEVDEENAESEEDEEKTDDVNEDEKRDCFVPRNDKIESDEPEEKNEDTQEETIEDVAGKKQGFFQKLVKGLSKTKSSIIGNIDNMLKGFTKIDEDLLEELEEQLIMADIGVAATMDIIADLRERAKDGRINDPSEIKELLKEEIVEILNEAEKKRDCFVPRNDSNGDGSKNAKKVMLIIGVNGVGKTTSVGKIAAKYKADGKKVLLAAADTFRAAAIEQLTEWANRSNIDLIKHSEGADPGAVVFDAIAAAKARKTDLLICDTAGRLHNKKNLMDELKKIYKIIEKEFPEAEKEMLLVLDATTGQNALQQAKLFGEIIGIDGLILTKLDGTAKGGIVVAISKELNIPVRYIGVGEGIDDLQEFDSNSFVEALFN